MVLKTECRCIDSSLKSILDAAIHNLEKESIGTRTDDYERVKLDLEKHLEALKNMGIPDSQIETMRQSIPRDPIFKQFDDLKTWLNECECSETDVIDWTQFPYHEVGYKKIRTAVPGIGRISSMEKQLEQCGVTSGRTKELLDKISEYETKIIDEVTNNVLVETNIKNMYPKEEDRTGANIAHYMDKLGILSKEAKEDYFNIGHEIQNVCPDRKVFTDLHKKIYGIRVKKGWARRSDIGIFGR